jgi:peptide/nickel transport system substrate-binding protein
LASPRSRWRLPAAALLVLVAVGVTASAGLGSSSKPTLTIATGGACGNQNPLIGYDPQMTFLSYEPLMWSAPNGYELKAGLATSWRVAPGNKKITLTLRRGVHFSDGAQFDARAVKAWLDFKVKQLGKTVDPVMGPVRSVRVLGPYKVQVTLKVPNPWLARAFSTVFPSTWTWIPSPRATAILAAKPKSTYLDQKTDGTGAFVYDASQSVTNDHCVYTANPYYWNKNKVKWGKIVQKNLADPTAILAALKTGQIDVMLQASAPSADAARSAGLQVFVSNNDAFGLSFFDIGGKLVPALGNARVRQALNYAVDRNTIAKALYGHDAVPMSNPDPNSNSIPPGYFNYYTYNPAKAKALLASAGYAKGFTIKALALGQWAGFFYTTPMCDAIAKNWAAIGVKVDITTANDSNSFNQEYASGKYEAVCTGWAGGPVSLWYGLSLKQNQGIEQHGWHDPVIDALWAKGQVADRAKAFGIWRQISARVVKQGYYVAMLEIPHYLFVRKGIAQRGGITFGYGASIRPLDWYPTG